MKITNGVGALLVAATVVTGAQAAVLFNNGGPVGGGISNDASGWVQANDFLIASNATVTGGAIYIEEQQPGEAWDGTFNYYIFADAGGMPGSVPLVSGAAQNIVQTSTGITDQAGTGFIQELDFDLAAPFLATGGTTYWFAVHLANNFNTFSSAAWSATGSGNEKESFGGTFDNWTGNGRDGAYRLVGSVPEPATVGLLAIGLAGLAARRRHRA